MRSQLIYINSANRVKGNPSDFTVRIPHGLLKADKMGRIKVSVVDAIINRSWYTVTSKNNSFQVVNLTDNITTTVTLPIGYYNVNQLRSTLSSSLLNWSVLYNNQLNKFTFVPPNNSKVYNFVFSNPCSDLLGFTMSDRPGGTFNSPIISSIPLKVNQENAIIVHSDLPKEKHSSVDNMSSVNFVESNVLIKMPISVQPFDNITFMASSEQMHSFFLSVQHVNDIRFWVTDESNQPLDLSYNWTLTLRVEYQEGEDTMEALKESVESIRDYVKLLILSKRTTFS